MKIKSLSRAEVHRRLRELSVDPFKGLSGRIDGCFVNAWSTGYRRRIERVSVCGIPKLGGNITAAYRVAKRIKSATGLTIHFSGGMMNGKTI